MELSSAKKILIIRLSSLGDILLSTPLVRSIKKKAPSVKLDFLLREEYKDALLLNSYVDELITFTNIKTDEIKENVKSGRYDIIIDLQNNLRSSALIGGSKAKKYRFTKKNIYKFLLVHLKLNLLKNSEPVPVRYASAFNNFNLDEAGPDLISNNTHSPLLKEDEKYIGLAPGAKHFTKRWPQNYYIELGSLLNKAGYNTVLFGGKSDRMICNEISKNIPGSINLVNNNELLQTSADMKKCAAIICNDSGMMHTASASGVPVVAIFGSTVKEFGFTPYKCRHKIVEYLSLPCRPCTHIGRNACPLGHFKCMLEIKPDAVFDNLRSLIDS